MYKFKRSKSFDAKDNEHSVSMEKLKERTVFNLFEENDAKKDSFDNQLIK